MMLKTIKSLILILALAGCATAPWIDTRQDTLRQEAGHLAGLVKANKITKVQAADRLDIKRIEQVGHNPYDDEVFAYYRHLATERDHKRIDLCVELEEWNSASDYDRLGLDDRRDGRAPAELSSQGFANHDLRAALLAADRQDLAVDLLIRDLVLGPATSTEELHPSLRLGSG